MVTNAEGINRVNGKKDASNDGKTVIDLMQPYNVRVRLRGTCDLIFHRWSCEGVAEKAGAAKGSKAKKSDDVANYVYRNGKNEICIPGIYLARAIVSAAKFKQDPRSPRKSAMDLFKAGVIPLTDLNPITYDKKVVTEWSYLHQARVAIQRSAITRTRPAFNAGWECEFELAVLIPEYISEELLNDVISSAGRLVGIADFRPTYGRFQVVGFDRF